jgi:hypothetical protein
LETVSDTARVLLVAALLSASAFAAFVWRLARLDPNEPARRIAELRVSQWAAVLLAATAAVPMGLAASGAAPPLAHLDAALAVLFVTAAGAILQREPRTSLTLAAGAFLLHAATDAAHRPGWLSPDLGPRWLIAGGATYDLCMAVLCFWARRR